MTQTDGVATTVCRFLCSGYWEPPARTSLAFEEEPSFIPSPVSGRVSYSINASQALRGVPIREGHLFHIAAEDQVEYVFFSLYINGFTFVKSGRHEIAVSLNPFTLVRNCKFQSQASALRDYKIFKVSLFPQSLCYYFGVKDDDERSTWVLDLSHTMRIVTQSLFPVFRLRTSPLDHVPMTHRRLMSGYLLHLEEEAASVIYCELQAHFNEFSKLVMYENETCVIAVEEVVISDKSVCCEKVGINCSCFCLDDHVFSSRTLSERKLWLRAFSNVKVKIQNGAPTPSLEQLAEYRNAINEHLSTLMERVEVPLSMDALLQKIGPLATEPAQEAMSDMISSASNIHL